MIGHSASMLVALVSLATAADARLASLSHRQMAAGQTFEIQTADRVFRGQMIDRHTGECRMAISRRRRTFGRPAKVYLLGATAGPQGQQMMVLMRQVKVGLKMELGMGDLEEKNRQLTGEVTAIRLD